MAIIFFLIYEVLLLKIPSANRQFCDTALVFFPLVFFESELLSESAGASGAVVRAAGAAMGGRANTEWRGRRGEKMSAYLGWSGALLPSQALVREDVWRALKWNMCPITL